MTFSHALCAFLKSIFICALFFNIYTPQSFGQTSISGVIQNTHAEPVPSANVILLNAADSSMIKGVVCDEQGKFLLEGVDRGKFIIVSTMVGYHKHYHFVDVDGTPLELVLVLEQLVTQLYEVS